MDDYCIILVLCLVSVSVFCICAHCLYFSINLSFSKSYLWWTL